jgi:hypothetical protein
MKKEKTIGEQPDKKATPKKRTMRPGGGKSKGNNFEGQIAKKLSAALAPLNFMRSPGSGARVGGKNFEKFGTMFGEEALAIFVADVVPINEKKEGLTFLHSIECKSYKTPDGFTSLVAGTANVFKWFEESVVDALKTNKNPILIFKWNNKPIFVATETGLVPTEVKCQLRISNNIRNLNIYYFDDLIQDSSFWYKSVL